MSRAGNPSEALSTIHHNQSTASPELVVSLRKKTMSGFEKTRPGDIFDVSRNITDRNLTKNA
jgi:hypothetical protein